MAKKPTNIFIGCRSRPTLALNLFQTVQQEACVKTGIFYAASLLLTSLVALPQASPQSSESEDCVLLTHSVSR